MTEEKQPLNNMATEATEAEPEPTEKISRPGLDLDIGKQSFVIIHGQFDITEDGEIHVNDAIMRPATKTVLHDGKAVSTDEADITKIKLNHQADILKMGLGALTAAFRAAASFVDRYYGFDHDPVKPWTKEEKDYVEEKVETTEE